MAQGKKKTHDEFVAEIKAKHPHIEVLGRYTSSVAKIAVRCNIDGYEWEPWACGLSQGSGCFKCANEAKRHSKEQFIESLGRISPDIEVLGDYHNAQTKTSTRCRIDGHEWYSTPNNLLRGQGCPKCAGNQKFSHDEFVRRLHQVSPTLQVIGQYTKSNEKIRVRCEADGYEWETAAGSLLWVSGCPKCATYGYNITLPASLYLYLYRIGSDTLGFGISNYFEQRDKTHRKNFEKHGVDATLIQVFEHSSGELVLDTEKMLKRSVDIIDTGIEGFKTEATPLTNLQKVISLVSSRLAIA